MNTMALPGDGKQSVGDEKFAAAMRAAAEFSVKARSLLDQIKPYIETNDPFAAMVEAHDRAQAFEAEQETRIFLGPPNGQ
jgi:hypothetical protein